MNCLCEKEDLALWPLPDEEKAYAQLLRWLSQAEISRYYGGDAQREVQSIREHVKKGDVRSCIISQNGAPIGYLQFYEICTPREKKALWLLPYQHPYGIDLFLGTPEKLGRGIGTRCMQMICQYLFSEKKADALCIDPRVDNPRAIRCYEKAGFSHIGTKEKGEKVAGKWIACKIIHRLP